MQSFADVSRPAKGLDQDRLVSVIEGRTEEVDKTDALKELAISEFPRRTEVLTSVVSEPEMGLRLRRTAAFGLGKRDDPVARRSLERLLDAEDSRVQADVVRSLGRIGDAKSLEVLEGWDRARTSLVAKDLAFAQSLIAYRHHIDRHRFSEPAEGLRVSPDERYALPVRTEAIDANSLSSALENVADQLPAVRLSTKAALRTTGRDEELVTLVSAEIETPAKFAAATKSNALPAVLLKKWHCPERYALAHYLFTHPGKDGELIITGTRPNGERTFAGSVRLSRSKAELSLSSLRSRYVPAMEIEGSVSLTTFKFEITRLVAETTVSKSFPARRPSAVVSM